MLEYIRDFQIGSVYKTKTRVTFENIGSNTTKNIDANNIVTFLNMKREKLGSGWFICHFYFDDSVYRAFFHEHSSVNSVFELIC